MGNALAFTVFLLLQAQADPSTAKNDAYGIQISRPPNNDEWQVKSEGGSLSVTHKVHRVGIVVTLAIVFNANNYSTKNAAEETWKEISAEGKHKNLKKTGVWQVRLPGNAAGGVNTHRLDMTFTGDDGTPMGWKVYHFNNRQSEHFYLVSVIGDQTALGKYSKELDQVLSSIRTFKPGKN